MNAKCCLALAAMAAVLSLLAAGCGTQPATQGPTDSEVPRANPSGDNASKPPPLPKPAAAPKLPVWQPDPTLVEQLGPYEDIDGFQIRPPKGYQSMQVPGAPAGAKVVAWAGPERADGTRPSVQLMLLSPPPEAPIYTIEQVLDSSLRNTKKRRSEWQQTATESGQVNGIAFVTASWQGTITEVGMKGHGVEYAGKEGATIIQLKTQDVEPHHGEALKLGIAAILTFRKKPL